MCTFQQFVGSTHTVCFAFFMSSCPVVTTLVQVSTGWKVRHTVGEGQHIVEKGLQTAFTLIHEFLATVTSRVPGVDSLRMLSDCHYTHTSHCHRFKYSILYLKML